MPILEFSQFDNLSDQNRLAMTNTLLWAVMLFPKDGLKRDAFIDSTAASALELKAAQFPEKMMPNAIAVWMSKGAKNYPKLVKDATETRVQSRSKKITAGQVHGGFFAAYVLLWAFVSDLHNGQPVGLGQAKETVSAWLGRRRFTNSKRHLDNVWNTYKTVAHLWAARFLIPQPTNFNDAELHAFLILAEILRSWAVNFEHPNAHEPFLNNESTWRVQEESAVIQ